MQASFDHIADEYDKSFTYSSIGKIQRDMVWKYLDAYLSENTNLEVLELNCGTGEDAIHMAEKGHKVLATDISPSMIEVARKKVSSKSLDHLVPLQQLGFDELDNVKFQKKFDVVFSNFGGLNCVNPITINQISRDVTKLLKPGGRFIAVIMPEACWWEQFYFFLKLRWNQIFRRSENKVKAHVDGQWVETWYYSPWLFQELVGGQFSKKGLKPIGIAIPPSYLETFFKKRPRFLSVLSYLEKRLNRFSYFAKFSDHYLIDLQLGK